MKMMKAVRIHNYGGIEALRYEEVPVPTIAADEILIKVHVAGINPVDWKIREGYFQHPLPLILGWDLSGEVAEVGTEITQYKKGDAVFAYSSLMRNGADAEYSVVKANEVAHKPQSLDHIHAAVVPLAALTAWQALFDHGKLNAGQRILIHAAAGGVGHYAVQLAKWKGAYVIGTASNKNKQFLLDLGIDEVIDYTNTDFAQVVKNVDIVLDTIGGETQKKSCAILNKNGIIVSIVDRDNLEKNAATFGVRHQAFVVEPNATELAQIAKLIDQGKIKSHVAATFSLQDVAKAHELVQSHHVQGKVALIVAM